MEFNQEIADKFCEIVATTTDGVHKILDKNELGLPSYTVIQRWLRENKTFESQYARAREDRGDLVFDEILEIADDTTQDTIKTDKGIEVVNSEWVNRSRLRVDARKFVAARLAPKKYGDKSEVGINIDDNTVKVVKTIMTKNVKPD